MARYEKSESNKGAAIVVIILIIIVIASIVYWVNKNNNESNNDVDTNAQIAETNTSVLNETITEENFDELTEEIASELGDTDELYYFSYATMYYMMVDGFSSAFTEEDVETAMYANIYGKTAEDLISEGKELMQENDITIDEWKANLEDIEDLSADDEE